MRGGEVTLTLEQVAEMMKTREAQAPGDRHRERRLAWDQYVAAALGCLGVNSVEAVKAADKVLAARDVRFPGPPWEDEASRI